MQHVQMFGVKGKSMQASSSTHGPLPLAAGMAAQQTARQVQEQRMMVNYSKGVRTQPFI